MNETEMNNFHLTYVGTITESQNPVILWDVLRELDIEVRITGAVDYTVKESMQGIRVQMDDWAYHLEAVHMMREAYVLLLLTKAPIGKSGKPYNAAGILTGKLFEYLAARRPIIGIGPIDGEAAEILRQTGAGVMIDYNDYYGMREAVLSCKNWMQ